MRLSKLMLCGALALISSHAMATIVDGVRQKPTYESSGFAAGSEAYLYNVTAGKFFTQGNSWATQASIGDEGRKVRFTATGYGDYTMENYCWRDDNQEGGYFAPAWRYVFFDSETALFVDRNNQANYYFAVEDHGGTFRLYASSRNPTFGDYAGAGLYVGYLKNTSATILSPFVDEDEAHVDWAFVSEANYNALAAATEIYNKAQELKTWIDKIQAENGDASSLNSVYLNESASLAELQTAIDAAQPLYIQALINNAADKENVDVTLALKNPDFENGETGWTVTAAAGSGANGHAGNVRTGGTASNQCYEAWNNSAFDIYQTLSEMPVGVYEIEVQGFYRYGRGDVAWNAYLNQNVDYVKPEGVPVYVYLNNNATNFVNVFGDERQITTASFYGNTDYSYQSNAGTTYYFPNGMSSAAVAFSNGMYKQSAFGLIANEGDAFRIGVRGSSSQLGDSWVIWDNFKLYYRGFKAEVVQPILETAMADLQQYASLLMGKSEFSALNQAIADAQTAISEQNGENMFKALNDIYNVKETVIASKDLFLAEEVSTDLANLREAIANVAGEKMSAATRTAATTLEAGIAGNSIYEGTQINQLKTDVSNAINALPNSVSLYSSLGTAITSLAAATQQKAYQTLLNEAAERLATAQTGYNAGSIADAAVSIMASDLNAKTSALNASATAYTSLNSAIGRLESAIATASTENARVAKSTLTKANLRLTASRNLYNEGTIADADIADRVTTIDDLITELTRSIELYRQFNTSLTALQTALTTEDKLSADTRAAAQNIYDTALAAYNEGTVDDNQIEAQIAALNAQVTNISTSVSLYADLADAYPTLEAVISLKALQTLVDEANTLYNTSAEGYAQGTIADADIAGLIAGIQDVIPQVQASAAKYADLAAAITRLQDAIAEASTDEARVAKSTLRKANLRLTASQTLYNNGTIADEDIADRVATIDQLIKELTGSIRLYQEFKTSLETLESALATEEKMSAATRANAQGVYDTALAAYNAGTVDDDQIEAQKNALNTQIEAITTSKGLYAEFNTAIGTLNGAIEATDGKVSTALLTAANSQLSAAQNAYTDGSIGDADIPARKTALANTTANVNAAIGLDAKAEARTTELATLSSGVQEAESRLAQAKSDLAASYVESSKKSEIEANLDDFTAALSQMNNDLQSINNRLTADKQAQTDAINSITTAYATALSAAVTDLTNMELDIADALAEVNDMTDYLSREPAAAIAASANIVELTAEYGTFCSTLDLDFTEVEGMKAYIVSDYIPGEGKAILTRVYNVPAGTGLLVVGTPEGRYEIPVADGATELDNLLAGTTSSLELPAEENGQTNCILANGSFGIGFYPTSGGTLAAGKAYLPLPTTSLYEANGVKGVSLVFDDATGISAAKTGGQQDIWYTVGGQQQQRKPSTPGVYVRNGKKVLVK